MFKTKDGKQFGWYIHKCKCSIEWSTRVEYVNYKCGTGRSIKQ